MKLLNKAVNNNVKFGLDNYVILLRGVPKSGKTTFYSQLVNEIYGTPNKGLLIPFEKGYSAIQGINVFPYTITPSMVIDGETFTGWEIFTQLIDELCQQEQTEDKIEVIAIDTVDELINVASEEVCRLSRIKNKKPCDTIDSAFGGFARGKKYLASMIKEQIEKLRSAGIGIIFIGHTKVKTLKTKIDEQEYQVLGSNLTEDYDRMFANDADFILMITEENKIVNGKMVKGDRELRFRGDGFYSAGSRLPNVPELIPLDAKVFVDTLKKAISEIANVSVDKFDTISEKEKAEDNKKLLQEKILVEENKEELIQKIKNFGISESTPVNVKRELVEYMTSIGIDLNGDCKITDLKDIIQQFSI